MTVIIKMHGTLRRFLPAGTGAVSLTVGEGTTVGMLLEGLKAAHDTWLVAINGSVVERSTSLHDGDLVECYEPVAGGVSHGASR